MLLYVPHRVGTLHRDIVDPLQVMSGLKPEPWKSEAGGHARPQNFSHTISRALAEMDPSEEQASLLQVTEYRPGVRLASAKEVEVLVETLDKARLPSRSADVF